jgi:hypothetical protein
MLDSVASQETRQLRAVEIEVLREALEQRLPSGGLQLSSEEFLDLTRMRPAADRPFLHGVAIGVAVSFPFALVLGIASAHWLLS